MGKYRDREGTGTWAQTGSRNGDIDRDGERDKGRDTDGDTKSDRDISAGYQTSGNNF